YMAVQGSPDNNKPQTNSYINRMVFSAEKHDAALIGSVAGQVNSANAAQLESQILARVSDGEHRWVLDLNQLDYISSAGLRVILMLAKRLREKNGTLILCGMQPHVQEVFDVSGFSAILTVAESRSQALQRLTG